MNKRLPLVIAHRGASSDRPENTLEAFTEARFQGADWVELDVRRSVDGVLVVHHDAHLADGRLIRETAADNLPRTVPSLAESLEAGEGMGVIIESMLLPGEPDLVRQVFTKILAMISHLTQSVGRINPSTQAFKHR